MDKLLLNLIILVGIFPVFTVMILLEEPQIALFDLAVEISWIRER